MEKHLSRRSFLQAGGLLLAGSLVDHTIGWAIPTEITRQRTLWAMGGWNFLEVSAARSGDAEEALTHAVKAIRKVDQTYSVFDPRTLLSRLNASSQSTVAVDNPVVLRALGRTLGIAKETGGAFDPTVESLMRRWGFRDGVGIPLDTTSLTGDYSSCISDCQRGVLEREPGVALDPGAWAKGYAAELAVQAAVCHGATQAQANCGFDIVRQGSGGWECLLRDPAGAPSDIALRCHHEYRAVATSANTESFRIDVSGHRLGHLMDPRRGMPAHTDLVSATAFADDGLTADAVASALFVMGSAQALAWLGTRPQYGAILLGPDWRHNPDHIQTSGQLSIAPSHREGEIR